MGPQRWTAVIEVFNDALELASADRPAFLRQACARDPLLRREVESLLREYDREPGFLEGCAAFSDPAPVPIDGDLGEGSVVGRYRLNRLIGHGGMGSVYLAERDDNQYIQQVALKLVKKGMDSNEILRRFRNERQILASLDHPNIARLFDGGIAEDGRPYFVMEYVAAGEPIDQYCVRKKLSVRQRLELFLSVCKAVHYAHQKLVVHRDLKASNILVSKEARVKLLDFGIAKLIDPEMTSQAAALTQAGLRPMTPACASPEQIRGEAVTTESDVYSLGVLLYGLLAGQPPYRFSGRDNAGIADIICHQDPEKPSTAATRKAGGGADAGSGHESDRDRSAARLQRELRGDLDNIVLMAMHKAPQQRYSSAEALAQDVRRFLAGRPVEARPATMGYRLRKFAGRNRVGVGAGALVLLSLLAGLAGTMWQARVAFQERDRARSEAEKAEHVASFIKGVFQTADPTFSRGAEITARELLDQAATRMENELAGQPAVRAQMMQTIAEVYMSLAVYDRAETLLQQALALRREELGAEHRDVAANLVSLGSLAYRRSRLQEADSYLKQGIEMQRRLLGEEHPVTALSLGQLAQVRAAAEDLQAAESINRTALALLKSHYGPLHAEVAQVTNNLAEVLQRQDRFEEAEQLMRSALAVRRSLFGNRHTAVLASIDSLAMLLREQNRFDEAAPLLQEALDLSRTLYGPSHPAVAAALGNLAGLRMDQGGYEEAASLYRQAAEMARQVLGEGHLSTVGYISNLGTVYLYLNQFEAARDVYRQVIPVAVSLVGEQHSSVADMRSGLSFALGYLGQPAEAEIELRRVLDIQIGLYGKQHTEVAVSLASLSTLVWEQGKRSEAIELARQALDIRRRLLPADHTDLANSLFSIGVMLSRVESTDAESYLDEALSIYRKLLPQDHPRVGYGILELAEVVLRNSGPAQAEPLASQAKEIFQLRQPDEDYGLWRVQSLQGACLAARGRHAEAEPLLSESYRRLKDSVFGGTEVKEMARRRLIRVYEALGRSDDAEALRNPR